MRVALDAEPALLTSGGLKRYVEELTQALRSNFPDDTFLYLPEPSNFFERRWWLYGAERACAAAHVDLYHGTNFSIPFFTRRPTVLTLHDLSLWREKTWHGSRAAARLRRRTPYLLRRATHIITPSEAIRTEAVARFRIAPHRITAIPLAASGLFQPTPRPCDPYLLFVGTQEPRKGLNTLLEAWRTTGRSLPLHIVGRTRADSSPLAPEPNLYLRGELPDAALPALYTNAAAVIYPSEYEGFGLPVLEAMRCGANVIVSRDPALRELTQRTAQCFTTVQELAHLLQQSESPQQERRHAAHARALQYSWAETARKTYAIYCRLLASK